ncbi:MAG: DUF6008 family protein [Patescibacteria group bacterium]
MNTATIEIPRYGSLKLHYATMCIVVLGTMFQVGHFAEHAVQFGMWLFSDRSMPWMSTWAMYLVHQIGHWAVPDASGARQMAVGMELLHLVGNGIFLVTIAAFYKHSPTKLVRQAFYVEGFHLIEHLLLTFSVIYLGKPIGFSTLFGNSSLVWDKEGVVGYRVFWHFAMNLVPSILIMKAMMNMRSKTQ